VTADILILKKKGSKIEVKITKRMRSGYAPPSYTIVVNLNNYKDLALFLHDLEDLQGAPVKKAVAEYSKGLQKIWPF